MKSQILELESLDPKLRQAIESSDSAPVLILENGRPAYILRSLTDNDEIDELVAQSPLFLATIEQARRQKVAGRIKTLREIQAKYSVEPGGDDREA